MDFSDDAVATLSLALEGVVRLVRALNPTSELSLTAVAALRELDRSGPARLTRLAAVTAASQPGMTQLVSRLEHAGLVARRADATDRRGVLIEITAAGQAALAQRRVQRAANVGKLIEELAPEQQAALFAALPALEAMTALGLDRWQAANEPLRARLAGSAR